MKQKMQTIASFVILFGFVFYLTNYDFSRFGGHVVEDEEKIPSWWLDKYGIHVFGDDDLTSDFDADQLSLLEEYEYHTNPLDSDTDDDGYLDGIEVKNGYSPIGKGKMDYDNDELPDKWEKENGLTVGTKDYDLDPDGDGLPNYLELKHLTNPTQKDTDGDGYDDLREIQNGYDPDAEGDRRSDFRIKIEKMGVNAPIVFSSSFLEKSLQEDLKSGVVRYPKTGVPGQIGNMVISGHSSNYAWVKGDYNYVFEKINDLEVGDKIVVEAVQLNGVKIEYEYSVVNKEIMNPNDIRIFNDSEKRSLTIATCWPLGTNFKRMVVKAQMQ